MSNWKGRGRGVSEVSGNEWCRKHWRQKELHVSTVFQLNFSRGCWFTDLIDRYLYWDRTLNGKKAMSSRSVSRNGKLDRRRAGVRTLPVVTQQRRRPHKLMFSLIQIHLHTGIFLGRYRYEGSYIHVPSSLFSQTREPTSNDTPGAVSTPSTQHLISNTILQKQGTMLHGETAPGLGQKTHLWIGTHTYPWVTKHLYFCVPSAERPWEKKMQRSSNKHICMQTLVSNHLVSTYQSREINVSGEMAGSPLQQQIRWVSTELRATDVLDNKWNLTPRRVMSEGRKNQVKELQKAKAGLNWRRKWIN